VNFPGSLDRRVDAAAVTLGKTGITVANRRTLSNGVRITFSDGSRTCGINFYYSKKKGFSIVPAGGDIRLSEAIREILLPDVPELPDETWIGSDEAGKGDYMGPLTVAAIFVDRRAAKTCRSIGITDSKLLSNESVRNLAERIKSIFNGCYSIVSVSPQEYNARFDELSKKAMNSLDLLAECHAQVISELFDKNLTPQSIIIDKFSNEKRIAYLLPEGDYRLELRVRGEADPAVAAASILARDAYLEGLESISRKFGIRAVSGSGAETDKIVRKAVGKFGTNILDEIAKVHFKNTSKVLQQIL